MTIDQVIATAINPALALLPARMDSPQARVLMLAIGLQESRFEHRRQLGNGPARGFWQFEAGGGVKGVMTHLASRDDARRIAQTRGVPLEQRAVWAALERDDVLAAAFARLLLWTDACPLPALGDWAGGWDYYLRTWRPGKPKPDKWPGLYRQAVDAAGGAP